MSGVQVASVYQKVMICTSGASFCSGCKFLKPSGVQLSNNGGFIVTQSQRSEWCELKVLPLSVSIFLDNTFPCLDYLGMIFNRNFELVLTHTPLLEEECNSADSADELPHLNIYNVYI